MRQFIKLIFKAIFIATICFVFDIPKKCEQLAKSETTIDNILEECKGHVNTGLTVFCSVCGIHLSEEITPEDNTEIFIDEWILIAENVEGTVYNAVPEQCDEDPLYTASMFRLNLDDVYSHRIIAMERTFMKNLNLKYGDVVKIEGTGKWDGIWQIQDTMNSKFVGQKKIDFLVPEDIKLGKWDEIKLYSLSDKSNTDIYKNNMAPQAKKTNS